MPDTLDTPNTLDSDAARRFLAAHPSVAYVDLYVIDVGGTPRGKRIVAEKLPSACDSGVYMPMSVFGSDILGNTVQGTGLGLSTGDADYRCVPLADSLVCAPWDERIALCQITMQDNDGGAAFADPYAVLSGVVARLSALGLRANVAIEMEFFVFACPPGDDAQLTLARGLRSHQTHHQNQVYGLAELDDFAPFLDAVRKAADAMDVPVESISSEYGPGQLEINTEYRTDARRACLDAMLLKRIVRTLAPQFGLAATFMAKPRDDLSGNGMHVHVSLVHKNGTSLFEGEPTPNDALRHAIGGLLAIHDDCLMICAPHGNSYRRFQNYSYAPTRKNWGLNNRSVAIRIPTARGAGTRFEHRLASADANPYLLIAAILAGVHHGLTNRIEPPPATGGDAYADGPASANKMAARPSSWEGAIDNFERSPVMQTYFSRAFVDMLVAVKRDEWRSYHQEVPDVDYRWYF